MQVKVSLQRITMKDIIYQVGRKEGRKIIDTMFTK